MDMRGTFIIGEFMGYEEEPWATDATKVNRRIGIKTGEYDKGFGETETRIERIDLINDQQVEFCKGAADKLKGKEVICEVVMKARDGKRGAWLSVFMPAKALPRVVPANVKAAS